MKKAIIKTTRNGQYRVNIVCTKNGEKLFTSEMHPSIQRCETNIMAAYSNSELESLPVHYPSGKVKFLKHKTKA